MNRTDFLDLLGKKSSFGKSTLGEVYELIDLFPYFQSAHLLLLKGLKDNEDIKFEKQLRESAMHIADREVLYYFLNREIFQGTETLPADQVTETLSEEVENKVKAPEITIEEGADTGQTVIEIANSDQLISEIEREEENDSDTGRDEPVLIHDILRPEDDELKDESASVILVMEGEEEGDEERVVFMDPGFSSPGGPDLLELDTSASDSPAPVTEYELPGTEQDEDSAGKVDTKKQKQTELIDRFINLNPRIEPLREKSNLPVDDLSKPHVEEKGGLVTETLAKIYINQGYYSKATEIYEKLSLKYPEKSSYFAAQIEKVKEFIKK